MTERTEADGAGLSAAELERLEALRRAAQLRAMDPAVGPFKPVPEEIRVYYAELDRLVPKLFAAARTGALTTFALAQPAAPATGATEAAVEVARVMLGKAADQFAFYADEHAKKRTKEGDAKGATNHQWALACAKAQCALTASQRDEGQEEK